MRLELQTDGGVAKAFVSYRVRSKERSWMVMGTSRLQAIRRALSILQKNGHGGKRVTIVWDDGSAWASVLKKPVKSGVMDENAAQAQIQI